MYYDSDYKKPNIRFLSQLIITILGSNVGFDMLGNLTSKYLVIETVEGLKLCADAFTKEGMHINTHALSAVVEAPLIDLYYNTRHKLPDVFGECPINEICGGGFLAHRYSKEGDSIIRLSTAVI